MFDVVIRGGPSHDVAIEGEFIAAVGHDLSGGRREIDAANLAILPVLFLRSPGGISHNPVETVLPEDVDAALATGIALLRRLEARYV